jgi:hypothetical protein
MATNLAIVTLAAVMMWLVGVGPRLREVNRLTLQQSLRSVPLALWDEGQQRLVAFGSA